MQHTPIAMNHPRVPLTLLARLCLSLGLTVSAPAWAQQALPPGVTPGAAQGQERLLREEQQGQERLQQGAPGAEVRTPAKPAATAASTVRNIRVERFEVDASQILSPQDIDGVLAPLRGQTVSLAELQAAVEQINGLYEARRQLTARAVLPTQTVTDGVVRVRLIESRTAAVRIEGNQALAAEHVRDRLRLSQDALLSVPALEEDLARFNRLNDTQLRANVVAGERFGTTDVEISVSEPKRLRVDAFADNAGRDTTGRMRWGATVRGANLLGISDAAQLTATTTRGSNSLAASYSLPINRQDTRLDMSASFGEIRIIDGPFVPLDITGRSRDVTVGLTHPLLTQADRAWSTYARLSDRQSRSLFSGFEQTHDTQRVITLGVAGDRFTDGHSWYTDQQLVIGSHDLGGDSGFIYWRGLGNRLDRLGERTQLISRIGAQYSQNRLLPSGEQFQVGGAYSVRGYSEGLLSGRNGYSMSAEIRYGMGALDYLQSGPDSPRLQWLAFIDHGGAFPYRPGNLKGIQRDDFLTGVGVGAVLEWRNISMRMVLAAPLRHDHPSELHPSDLRLNAFFNISLQ